MVAVVAVSAVIGALVIDVVVVVCFIDPTLTISFIIQRSGPRRYSNCDYDFLLKKYNSDILDQVNINPHNGKDCLSLFSQQVQQSFR